MVKFSGTFTWPENGSGSGSGDGKYYKLEINYDERPEFVESENVTATLRHEETEVGVFLGTVLNREASWKKQMRLHWNFMGSRSRFATPMGKHPKSSTPSYSRIQKQSIREVSLMYKIELHPDHQKKDLSLRILNEILDFLKEKWTLAVAVTCCLSRHLCKWKENRRDRSSGDRNNPEQKAIDRQNTLKLQRHFCRIGFLQAGAAPGKTDSFFVTHSLWKHHQSEWLRKEEADQLHTFEGPEKHEATGLDEELASLVKKIDASATPPRISGMPITGIRQQHSNSREETISLMEDLVRRGASIHNSRALFLAAGESFEDNYLLVHLIRLSGDVNLQDEYGSTPLHVAAHAMKSQNIEYLLGIEGADASITDKDGETALQSLQSKIRSHSEIFD